MSTITSSPRRFKLFGATLAMAVLAVALLAVVFTAGSAQAQPDPNLNDGKYTDPQPCGLNVDDVPEDPDAEFSEGHVALFDAYWDYNTQTLNNNLCPPLAVHTVVTERDGTKRIDTGRNASNIDVNTTVFHAGDEFKHTITAAEKTKYDFLPPAGTVVWWLKQDDPIAEAAEPEGDEEPELVLGLSAGLFHEDDWYAQTCTLENVCTEVKPLEYHFEAERGLDGNVIPFVVFEDDAERPIWDSRLTNTQSIPLDPGEYKHYNWVFFPGPGQSHTYVLEVHMKGHVRTALPTGRTTDNWKPLTWPNGTPYDPTNTLVLDSINTIVTSELVKEQYTIHVGPLTLDEQPVFGVPLSVQENSAEGTLVGAVIPVFKAGSDTLTYELSGEGHRNFTATAATGDTTGAQIKVAAMAHLDYETRNSYDLVLSVRDGKSRDGGTDDLQDDTIALSIKLTDDPADGPHAGVTLSRQPATQSAFVGDVAFTATTANLPSGAQDLHYTLYVVHDNDDIAWTQAVSSSNVIRVTGPKQVNVTRKYKMGVEYYVNGHRVEIYSNSVSVTWH